MYCSGSSTSGRFFRNLCARSSGGSSCLGRSACGLFSDFNDISLLCLIITGVIAVFVSIADNFFPVTMTKKFGGSKYATTGATIGLIIGFFTGPWGIILGPFFGALVGEWINKEGREGGVFKAAFGAFLGFLLGTGLKMITVLAFIWIFVISFIK